MTRPNVPFKFLIFLSLALLSIGFLSGCSADDDDDNDASPSDDDSALDDDIGDDDADDDDLFDDDSADDDVDDDADDDADDDTEVGPDAVLIDPATRAIPQGFTKGFEALAHYPDDTYSSDEPFVFSTSDDNVATVDQTGAVTAVADGAATITVTLGDLTDTAQVRVGADVFFFDAVDGFFGSYDRASETVNDNALGDAKGDFCETPNDGVIVDGVAYVADSGHSAANPNDAGGIVPIDLFNLSAQNRLTIAGLDNPWSIAARNGELYVTGNLSDNLAIVNLDDMTSELVDLPDGCSPAGVAATDDAVFVGCTYFNSVDFSYGPGKIEKIDLATGDIVLEISTTQINPEHIALSPDGDALWTVCTGNYVDQFGAVDRIDTATGNVVFTTSLGMAPASIAINAQNRAFIGENFAGSIYVIDTSANTILRGDADPISVENAFWIFQIRVSPLDGRVYAGDWTNAQTLIIDPQTYEFLAQPAMNNPAGYMFWE